MTLAYFLGSSAKEQLGIAFSVEGLEQFRLWVQGLGWLGPAVYILLVVFRLFIGLSSHLVFILGGLAFGVVGGIIWGSIGLLASAMVLFYLARMLGSDWVERRFDHQYSTVMERVQRMGVVAIFAITAHPVGIITPVHLAAGIVGIRAGQFALAIALAAPIRAAPYAFLGTAVLDLSLAQSLGIGGILVALFILPLFIPRVREWMWGARSEMPDSESRR